ncbi:hypothetical protein [Erwinia pyrifoliae]|uniref:Uncharacterized protein n=1 Tax=Erwinia pyrifoliae TaxID=79967 RepID=A0ABY5XCF3_ERWPY|nr:hypothetical protein [Erwinia pyrifoliae]MCU8587256.1 hypothetical protein [Erwinia pyrifoliae]UWS35086.1 hypothetical protein NYP84_08075 [Erwinia pyrifoliae]
MSLLDTFVQVFEFDTRQADAAFKNVRRSTDDIIDGMKRAQHEADKAAKSVSDFASGTETSVAALAQKTLGVLGELLGVSSIFSESVSRAEEVEALDKLGKKINVATADVDAFAGSVAELGGARESAQDDLSAMAKAFGGTTDSMEEILATADKVKGMNFDKAKAHLANLGVTDDKTIELMMKGRHEMQRMMGLQKAYSGITKESIEQSRRFNQAMQGFRQSSGLLKNSFLEMVLPYLTKGMEFLSKFVGFCRENKHLIIGFFLAVGVAVAAYYVPPMLAAASATLAATWPILAIIAIIAALAAAFALVYDDIMNFIDGNDSMIGRILDAYPELKQVVMTLWEAFKSLFEYLSGAAKFVADVVVDAYNTMNNALNQFIDWLPDSIKSLVKWGAQFGGVFDNVADAVVGIFTWMWEQVQKVIGGICGGLETIQKGWSVVAGWFGADDEKELTIERKISAEGEVTHRIPEAERPSPLQDIQNRVGLGKAQIAAANNHPLNPVTSQAISNRSSVKNETTLNIGEVKVETKATDAKGMAAGTKDALQEQLQDLGQQTQTGLAI